MGGVVIRRLWAAALTLLAVVAVFAVLAAAQRPFSTPATVLARTASGQLVRVPASGGVHATTQTSPAAASVAASASPSAVAAAPATRTS